MRLEEPVHQPSTRRHEHAKPPPLIGPRAALGALEQYLVGQVAPDLASTGSCSNEGVERSGGQHFRRVVSHVERHEGRAIGLVEIETLSPVVAVGGDSVLLSRRVSGIS